MDDDSCIGCSLCQERAPENLEMDEDAQVARVARQPGSPEEDAACEEAADYCPTGGLYSVD